MFEENLYFNMFEPTKCSKFELSFKHLSDKSHLFFFQKKMILYAITAVILIFLIQKIIFIVCFVIFFFFCNFRIDEFIPPVSFSSTFALFDDLNKLLKIISIMNLIQLLII